MDIITDFFKGMDRQGPGGDEQTRTALGLIRHLLPKATRAVDIGCGTGRQTAVLASEPGVSVTAVDLLPEMVEGMKERMRRLGLQDRVEGVVASMDALPFREGSFDLFWAEGSVYNIGFRRGLVEWRRFLRPGGCIAVTECSWLSEERPAEGNRGVPGRASRRCRGGCLHHGAAGGNPPLPGARPVLRLCFLHRPAAWHMTVCKTFLEHQQPSYTAVAVMKRIK